LLGVQNTLFEVNQDHLFYEDSTASVNSFYIDDTECFIRKPLYLPVLKISDNEVDIGTDVDLHIQNDDTSFAWIESDKDGGSNLQNPSLFLSMFGNTLASGYRLESATGLTEFISGNDADVISGGFKFNSSQYISAGDNKPTFLGGNTILELAYDRVLSNVELQVIEDFNLDSDIVTQITSIVTPVTIDNKAGIITTFQAVDVSEASSVFTVNNTFVTTSSIITVTLNSYSGTWLTNGIPYLTVENLQAGSFDIRITNIHSANALLGTCDIAFNVFK